MQEPLLSGRSPPLGATASSGPSPHPIALRNGPSANRRTAERTALRFMEMSFPKRVPLKSDAMQLTEKLPAKRLREVFARFS
ncbi:MAG: hypothetical protein NTW86_25095 [Candidatus Sumerlaeota bacterium]|nr:hypothetical protein [Candidatus Sumerlaeota bacterium]